MKNEITNNMTIANTLFVKVHHKYGNRLIYPNCPLSFAFTDLLGTKTLPRNAIETIKGMGFQFKVESEEI